MTLKTTPLYYFLQSLGIILDLTSGHCGVSFMGKENSEILHRGMNLNHLLIPLQIMEYSIFTSCNLWKFLFLMPFTICQNTNSEDFSTGQATEFLRVVVPTQIMLQSQHRYRNVSSLNLAGGFLKGIKLRKTVLSHNMIYNI